MKVYALREMVTDHSYIPARGYHSSLAAAKKQAKELFNRTAPWDVATYEVAPKFTKEEIISLINGDSVSSTIDGKVISDFMTFNEIVFKSAAMKRRERNEL